jgi:hypothetical protein
MPSLISTTSRLSFAVTTRYCRLIWRGCHVFQFVPMWRLIVDSGVFPTWARFRSYIWLVRLIGPGFGWPSQLCAAPCGYETGICNIYYIECFLPRCSSPMIGPPGTSRSTEHPRESIKGARFSISSSTGHQHSSSYFCYTLCPVAIGENIIATTSQVRHNGRSQRT